MQEFKVLKSKKTIALVAHDHKKQELLDWVIRHKETLANHHLVATGTTGKIVEEALNIKVQRMMSGPLGGDQQLGAMIADGTIDMVIFFWDPMQSQPHDSDVKAFLRLCVVWNIPTANNASTADFLLSSPLMKSSYSIEIPDYSGYLNRAIEED